MCVCACVYICLLCGVNHEHLVLLTQHWSENQRWLVDAAIRVMCVFALDRFADFVSDQVSGWLSERCVCVCVGE